MSDPPAADDIALPIVAAAVAFTVSSAAFAAGAPGVPAAASVAASATWMAASDIALAACIAAATAGFTPRQAGRNPIITVIAVGPPVRTGGNGCATGSVIRAAAGILLAPYHKPFVGKYINLFPAMFPQNSLFMIRKMAVKESDRPQYADLKGLFVFFVNVVLFLNMVQILS
jgi:hypothetical protein